MTHTSTIMFISPNLSAIASGGKTVAESNLKTLKACSPHEVSVISIGRTKTEHLDIPSTSNRLETALANLSLYSGCLNKGAFDAIISEISRRKPSIIFLDSSKLGRIARAVKTAVPDIHIITFFHNIEFDFNFQCYHGAKRLLYLPAFFSDWINERWAIQYSDTIVALHQADSIRLHSLYGRKADYLHPICLNATRSSVPLNLPAGESHPPGYVLFVGSPFPPNLEALRFLRGSVMPHVKSRLLIVGSQLELFRQEFSTDNTTVIGSVNDLSPYYCNSKFVVTPIFSGSGMKVKVAEALMHGKCVVGTKFSFIGYEKAIERGACVVAESAEQFIDSIDNFAPPPALEAVAKDLYRHEFSLEAGISRMKSILSHE